MLYNICRANINLAVQNLGNYGILSLQSIRWEAVSAKQKRGVGLEMFFFLMFFLQNVSVLKAKKHSAKPCYFSKAYKATALPPSGVEALVVVGVAHSVLWLC